MRLPIRLLTGFYISCAIAVRCFCSSCDSVSLDASTMNVQNQQKQSQTAGADGDGTAVEEEHIATQAQNVGPREQHALLPEGILERVPPHHQALVKGIFSLYEVLISMRYISRSDIYWPPYPTSLFSAQQWLSEGFEQEAVDLLALLPYPKVCSNLGPWLTETAWAYGYAGNDYGGDARDLRYQGEKDIEPWTFRFTNGMRDGDNCIYNIRDGTITIWNMEDYRSRSPTSPSYHSFPARPAAEALSEWIDNFITLSWIPWRSDYEPYRITTATSLRPNTETELRTFVTDPTSDPFWARWVRNGVNAYASKKKMYLKHGWPHAFRGEEFERAREQWQMDFNSLENAVEEARPWGAECSLYFPEQDQALDQLSDFLAAGAGEHAA